jgi:hypothetical protein
MKIKAEITLSRAQLEALTDEDLRFIEAEISRRLSDIPSVLEQIHQIAADGWGTSGETRALEQIHKLTTPLLVQRVKEMGTGK